MKKSQVAAALALAYVAGTVVAPVSKIYAEAVVTPDCAASVVETTPIITIEELEQIVANIKSNDIYKAYEHAAQVKAQYETLGSEIDTKVSHANFAKMLADSKVNSAKTTLDGKKDDTIAQIRNLSGVAGYTVTDIEEVVFDIAELPLRVSYLDVINAETVDALKQAVIALNVELAKAQQTTDSIDWNSVHTSDADTVSDIKSAIVAANAKYAAHNKLAQVESEIKSLNGLRDAAKTAEEAVENAETEQNNAVDAIDEVLQEIKDATGEDGTVTKTSDDVVMPWGGKTVAATNNLIADSNIANFDNWQNFITKLDQTVTEGGFIDSTNPQASMESIETALNTLLSSDDITAAFNPTNERKVCDAKGLVSVKGNLPLYHFAIEVIPFEGKLPAFDFDGIEQSAYSITLKYKGATYTTFDAEGYDVTVNVPDDMIGATAKVFHIANTGAATQITDTEYDDENKTITFHTDHFSIYALVGENNFGGYDDDPGFTNPEGPDDTYGGNDSEGDTGFNVTPEKPIVSVNPDPIVKPETPEVKLPEVEAPNTGAIVAETASSKTNATAGIIASFIAIATAAMAAIARFVRRDA